MQKITICRSGSDIKLTEDESERIYRIVKSRHLLEDVIHHCIQRDDCEKLEDLDYALIANKAEHTIKNNDSYWESYWLSIEYTTDEYLKERK